MMPRNAAREVGPIPEWCIHSTLQPIGDQRLMRDALPLMGSRCCTGSQAFVNSMASPDRLGRENFLNLAENSCPLGTELLPILSVRN